MSKKSPQLRFEGFTDGWEERKLSDLFIKGGSGGTPKSTNKAFYDGDIPFLGISDITKSNGFINNTEKHISSDGLNSSAAWIVSKGAISLAMYASVGKLAILNIDAATSQAFYNMIFDDYDLRDLVYQRLNKANELSEWNKLISTGTQSNLNADKVKNFQMYLPKNHDEIKLISTFFKQIDNTIALHQRKLDLLKEQKKGFLQKMFPKNGAKVPELRFAGFADDWEERKLGDVVGEIQSGNRLPKDSLTSGNIPYVVAQTKNEGVFKTISKKTLDYNGNPMKLFPGNSISFSIDNPEAMFYRSTEFYTSNIMRVIHADYLSHQQYLFILENMKSFTRGYDWSRKFSGPVVSNLEYLQPNEQEQCKIGSFILAFDNIITLHQRKLDLLKEQKKGLLQKMFV